MSAAAGPLARAGEIGALCRRYRMRRLDLFGSAAAGREGADSDPDFLVEFGELPEGGYADAYFGPPESLARLFARPVGLADGPAIRNPYFRQSVEATRRTVYEAADDGPHAPARESARC